MKKVLIGLVLTGGLLASCREEPETDCDRVVSRVVDVINDQNQDAVTYYIDETRRGTDLPFTIAPPYIIIEDDYLNLCLLKRFNVDNNSTIELYF